MNTTKQSYKRCFQSLEDLDQDYYQLDLDGILQPMLNPSFFDLFEKYFWRHRVTVSECIEAFKQKNPHYFVRYMNFTKDQYCLAWSRITPSPAHESIIKELNLIKKDINHLIFWWSYMEDEFFISLSKAQWTIKSLSFNFCNLGNSLGVHLLDLSNLRELDIQNDPLGNTGAKIITKIQAPKLQIMTISNTNLTNDAFTILKKERFLLQYLHIGFHLDFSKHLNLKYLPHLFNYVQNDMQHRLNILLCENCYTERHFNQFFFYLSKLEIPIQWQQPLLSIQIEFDDIRVKIQKTRKLIHVLSKIFDFD